VQGLKPDGFKLWVNLYSPTDAERDDLGVGVGREVRALDAVDLGEQVARLQLAHVGVARHLGGRLHDQRAARGDDGGGGAPVVCVRVYVRLMCYLRKGRREKMEGGW
jgi:hypothetical protein